MRPLHTRYPLGLAVSLMLIGLLNRPGAAQLLGPEFQANSFTAGHQLDPVVAADGAGNFVVAWASGFQDGSSYGVFGQRFDAAGNAAGSEFLVNSYTTGEQWISAVAADGSGNFVVLWESVLQDGSGDSVFAQRFDSAGAPMGSEFLVNTTTTGSQVKPAVATDGSGNFVVVWQSPGGDALTYDLFGQRFDSAGTQLGSEFLVNSYTTGAQLVPAVAADSTGSFLVVWASDGQDGSAYGVFGQRFNAAGLPAGSEFRVNTYTTASQWAPTAAADGAGNFIVAWQSSGQDGSYSGVFGQRYDPAGAPLDSEFRINTQTASDQQLPKVAADGAGDFIVAWQSYYLDGSKWGVFAQRFKATGAPVGGEFQVNSYTTENQYYPAVTADGVGNFVVVWRSYGQDGDRLGTFGRQVILSILVDGFESGDVCSWSAAVGGGGTCPRNLPADRQSTSR